ncbi:MAG: CotH kinase family protein [Bacteroidetes bacterium]|nr:CotH kinase family protein [Bacteroidota bacterium]HET6244272.1 CotH kinase family protein [Bacteroidia bacterium]
MKKLLFFALFLNLFLTNSSYSQIVINEISNANGCILIDKSDESYDWIELYNSSTQPYNLRGHSVTDNTKKLDKWTFPEITIQPLSYLVVFASGMDIKSGQYLHTNFKLKSTGEKIILSDDDGNIIDFFEIGQLQYNHSFGRKPDGATQICLFNTPTPAASNNNSSCYDGYEPAPVFSINAGFYPSSQTVELYTPSQTGIIKYRLDGNVPSNSSTTYSLPISADKTTVVSAICYSSGNRLPSSVVKRTYFINDSSFDLPVFSITMAPDDLFDDNIGIYTNYEQDWEKQCYIEYFDKQKVKQFELSAGIKIQGNYSKIQAQKSFRILTRKEYGTSWLEYPLIPEKPHIKSYKRFNLRNGGGDYSYCRIRDAFMQRVLKDSPVDRMGYEPAIVFLNGEYWGQYEIREQQNTQHLLKNYGIPEDQVDLLYHKGDFVRAQAGSVDEFYVMHDYISSISHQKSDFYKLANQTLDLENFTDYFIAGIYYSNRDWIDNTAPANNIRLYREKKPDSKWKYMFWDLDMGSGLYDKPTDRVNNLAMVRNPMEPNVHSDIFRYLSQNTEFRNYFVNRYADLMNTAFQLENIKKVAYDMRDSIASSMERHQDKWGKDYAWWHYSVDKMVNWHKRRMPYARKHLNDEFSLKGQVNITLTTSPPNSGRIKISTIIPDSLPWKGVYYNGVPVTITAIPNPGFTFEKWGINQSVSNPVFNEAFTVNIGADDTFTAYFTGLAAEPKITFSEINYHSSSANDAGDWLEVNNYGDIALNITGWYLKNGNNSNLYQIPFGTIVPVNGHIVFSCDTQKFVSQHPFVAVVKEQLPFNLANSSEQISLLNYDYKPVISVTYLDSPPWPKEADGMGRTLELKDPLINLDLSSNWFAGCIGGSPGIAYNAQCLTIVDEVEQELSALTISPNPASGSITVEMDTSETNEFLFELYDMFGVKIKQIKFTPTTKLIVPREGLLDGIYFIKVSNGKGFIAKKIIYM